MPALALSLGLPFGRRSSGGAVPGPPGDPTGFTATAGNQLITLTWDALPEADTFEILYGLTNFWGSSNSLAAGLTGTSFTFDSGESIQAGEKYYFWIQATNGEGTSGYVGPITARSYVAIPDAGSANLTTPAGTWTLGTLFFGSVVLPAGCVVDYGGNQYAPDGSNNWEDINTADPSSGVSISGAFSFINNTGSTVTFWNTEP